MEQLNLTAGQLRNILENLPDDAEILVEDSEGTGVFVCGFIYQKIGIVTGFTLKTDCTFCYGSECCPYCQIKEETDTN